MKTQKLDFVNVTTGAYYASLANPISYFYYLLSPFSSPACYNLEFVFCINALRNPLIVTLEAAKSKYQLLASFGSFFRNNAFTMS